MEKPVTMRYNEFIDSMTKAINGSGLPAFVVLYVLRDIMSNLQHQAEQQLADDVAAYEASLKESEVNDADVG